MKFKCALSHCQRTEDLICSPVEPQQLLQWQNVLSVEENEFHVCHLHFDESNFEIKKVLKQNAVPTMLFDQSNGKKYCECCFKTFTDVDDKFRIGTQLQDVILKLLDLQVQHPCCVCFECKKKLESFTNFVNEVNEKQKMFGKKKPEMVKVKEEPLPDMAEILIAQNMSLDPFECEDDFIKEESSQDSESKNEPEVLIFEDCFTNQPLTNSRKVLQANVDYQQQIGAHNEHTQYVCDVCDKIFQSKDSLLKHIRHHITQNNKQHSSQSPPCISKKSAVEVTRSCPVCYKTMKSNSIYSHIRLVHNKERDQICQICGKALKTSYDLKVHLRKHSGERPEICETCGKTFISYAQLYKHRKVRHMIRENYQCLICLKNLLSRFKLKCHTERFHPDGFDNGLRVNEETNCYHCKICPLQFIAMHKYEKHLQLNDCHKYEGLVTVEDVKMAKNAKGEFKCQECGSILNTMKGLKKHMRFVHPKEPQSCKICFKQLKNPHTLWQHMTLSHKQPVKKRKL